MADEERKNFPEEFDGQLDCASMAVCCEFNRIGSLLAVGCNDGRLVIWDLLTRAVAKNILAHAGHPVSSISWSRNGHKVASASLDNSVAIWHVLSGECKIKWIFKAPLMKVQFNPRNENQVLVCPYRHAPILLQVDYDTERVKHKYLPTDREDAESNMTASFDRRGRYIFTGGAKGRLTIMKCPSVTSDEVPDDSQFDIVSSFRIQPPGSAPAAIREIEFARKDKRYFLVNSADRTLRLYDCDSAIKAGINGTCDEIRKFQDMVYKTLWRRCCFSPETNVTYICGGSGRQHTLYIWDIETGAVKKMLQGASKGEMLLDMQWHPSKPIVASVSSGGFVLIWARAEGENWSAYAPTFEELDENREYDERESEFDIEDADAAQQQSDRKEESDNENVDIDVKNVTLEEGDYKSSDEEGYDPTALEFIPIGLEEYEMIDAASTHNETNSGKILS